MNYISLSWTWIGKHAKTLEVILLVLAVIFSYSAYCSSQEQVRIMREQLRSDMTVEKFKLLADHYNGTFSSNPIFQDYLKNHRFGDTYSDIEMRYFIDEFEYVKTMRDLLGYQDKTLGIFYGRTLLDACRNKNIYTIAKKDSKGGFLSLCALTDQMR